MQTVRSSELCAAPVSSTFQADELQPVVAAVSKRLTNTRARVSRPFGSDPLRADTDRDGLSDGLSDSLCKQGVPGRQVRGR